MYTKLKIVHVMNWHIPDFGYQENFLPFKQQELGHEVHIICSNKIPTHSGFEATKNKIKNFKEGTYNDNNVIIHRLPTIKLAGELLILKGLKTILEEIKPDVVHSHGTYLISTFQTYLLMDKLGYKLFIDDHSHENNLSFYHKPSFKILKNIYKFNKSKVNSFLPVTGSAKVNLTEIWDINDNQMQFLPLGTDTDIFKPSEKLRLEGRNEFNLNEKDILIISSGKFRKERDIDTLLISFGKLNSKFSNIYLLLLGSAEKDCFEMYNLLVDKFNIKDKVFFKEFVKNRELAKYYNAADIGVWPGDHTITVNEAAGTALPIIIPDGVIAYNILKENNSALGFERGNAFSLYNKISKIIENQTIKKDMGNAAYFLVKNQLSWNKIAQDSIKIYNSC